MQVALDRSQIRYLGYGKDGPHDRLKDIAFSLQDAFDFAAGKQIPVQGASREELVKARLQSAQSGFLLFSEAVLKQLNLRQAEH